MSATFAAVLAFLALAHALPEDEWVTTVNGVRIEEPGKLVFNEDFDILNLFTWQHEKTASGGGNWEFQIYQNNRSNSYVEDGKLIIRPTLTDDQFGEGFVNNGVLDLHGGDPSNECTNPSFGGCIRNSAYGTINPTIAARLRTTESFSFKYGKVEVRAKMPLGDWIWPAIWLLPRWNDYGTWPASGEIDIVETRGNRALVHNGNEIGQRSAGSTLHYGPYYPVNGYENAHAEVVEPEGNGFGETFHDYVLTWTPRGITFEIDGEVIKDIVPPEEGFWKFYDFETEAPGADNPWKRGTRMAPFDNEFYLIINVAVGGTNNFFPDDAINGGPPKPWLNNQPNAAGSFWDARGEWLPTWQESPQMEVDYIRVYSLEAPKTS